MKCSSSGSWKTPEPSSEASRTRSGRICARRGRSLLRADKEDAVVAPIVIRSRSHDCRCCGGKGDEPGRLGIDEVPATHQLHVPQPRNKRASQESRSANWFESPHIQSKGD